RASAQCRALYQDEVEQLIPVELRRSRPNAGLGQPPADRTVRQVQQAEKAPKLVDISATRDNSLWKRILVEPPVGSPAVLPGAELRAKITATLGDETLPLEQRLLHGPKEHCWTAGSGTHCQLLELMVCSMQLGETCTASSSDKQMMADAGLLCGSTIIGEVEFVVSLTAVSDCRFESAHGVIKWAGEQKAAAANALQRSLVHLSLLQYSAIVRELTHLIEGGGLDDVVLQEAQSCRLASRLNRGLCLLRLGL
ncbi:FKBP62, partial [Symbiodinium sp. KB8]